MKVKNLLMGLIGVFGVLTVAYAALSVYTLNTTNEYIQEAIEKGKTYQKINDDSRAAQVDFQRQVQEWKNILIRGNDSELYEKHLKQFREKENTVNNRLNNLSKKLKDLNHVKEANEINDLMKQHLDLGERYNTALGQYNKEDLTSYLKIDVMVRGMDRVASKGMDEVSLNILKLTESEFEKINQQVKINYQEKLLSLLIISAIGMLLLLLVGALVTKTIFKYLGNEPKELNEYFAKLANGDLKVNLDINGKDKSSLSYNAKLMQFKLKNLITAVRDSSEEVEEAIKSIGKAKNEESKIEAIGSAKEITKVLKKLTDRFEV